jgi:hypothetical protein
VAQGLLSGTSLDEVSTEIRKHLFEGEEIIGAIVHENDLRGPELGSEPGRRISVTRSELSHSSARRALKKRI